MKTTRFLIATLICAGLITAGLAEAASIPAKINYQGVLKDAAGAKIDGTVDIDLSLLPLGGGTAVFSESHTGVSVVGGLFSLKIGGVNDMSAVSFDTAYELEITVDGDLLSPNTPLCSAPYALGVVGGAQGPQGKQGADGADGATGAAGAAGAQGPQGDAGPVGSEFWDANGDDIYNTNSGKVGIGTQSPTAQLEVQAGGNPALRVYQAATGPGHAVTQNFAIHNAGAAKTDFAMIGGGRSAIFWSGENGFFFVGTRHNGALGEKFRIDPEGDVKIGNAGSPEHFNGTDESLDIEGELRVRGGNPTAGDVLTAIDDGGSAEWAAPAGGGGATFWKDLAGGGAAPQSPNGIKNANANNRVGIGPDGAFSFGTPGQLCIFNGGGGLTDLVRIGLNSNPFSAADQFNTSIQYNGGYFDMTNHWPNNSGFRWFARDNVGIVEIMRIEKLGLLAPSLNVKGDMRVNGAIVHASDARFKKDIRNVSGALDKVSQLNGVTWTWADAKRQPGTQMGVVAQDVEKVAPELVSDYKGYKSVNYSGLNALTIEAIKELRGENAAQRAEMEVMKAELQQLKNSRN